MNEKETNDERFHDRKKGCRVVRRLTPTYYGGQFYAFKEQYCRTHKVACCRCGYEWGFHPMPRPKLDERLMSEPSLSDSLAKKTPTSLYRGVHRINYKDGKVKWAAVISINHKQKHLGTFSTEEKAAAVYEAKVKELGIKIKN